MKNEVIEKILDRFAEMNTAQINALVAVNFGEWRKNEGSLAEWNPAGNPNHAHDLIDKLMSDGLFINLYGRPNDWTCEILDKTAKIYAEVTTTSMPRAVCEAALITVLTKYGQMIKVD